jgi:hypothetical protein
MRRLRFYANKDFLTALAMSMPSPEQVKAQMNNETGVGHECYLARRSVLAWQKAGSIPPGDITHLVKLYMSLKKLLGADGGRLTAQCFTSFTRSITHSRTLKRKLWVVPLANMALIHMPSIEEFIVNTDSVTELPDFMDLKNCMLVDQAVPQSSLGAGVTEFEVQVSDQTKSKSLPSPAAIQGGTDSGGIAVDLFDSSRGGAVPKAPAPPTLAPAPEASPRRTLERVDSVTDHEAAENIATDTKDAFERGDLVSSNKLVAKSAEFWAAAMFSHLQYLERKFTGDPKDFVWPAR